MNSVFYKTLLIVAFLSACFSPSKLTTWKDQNKLHNKFNKVLIVGFVQDSLSETKTAIEDCFASSIKKIGYHPITTLEASGSSGFANMGVEQSYVQLCNQGIDAVLTIALLDKKKVEKYHDAHTPKYSSSYYYNRIMNYGSMQADLQGSLKNISKDTRYLWEVTLFNLTTLTPAYWAQTKPFSPNGTLQASPYCHLIINNMQKKRILKR